MPNTETKVQSEGFYDDVTLSTERLISLNLCMLLYFYLKYVYTAMAFLRRLLIFSNDASLRCAEIQDSL